MSKRKLEEFIPQTKTDPEKNKKYSMDSSDEDEDEKEEKKLDEKYLDGVEDGPSVAETNAGFTAFNMKEELEEGHFDADGHYHWKKEKEIRDNWLDEIDWAKVQADTGGNEKSETKETGSDDDSDGGNDFMFNPTELYRKIVSFLQPGESVSKALCRLGKGKKKLTTAERWKKKKDPNAVEDENSANITKLTELANELLTRTGNMDIYQETFEQIQRKIKSADKSSMKVEAESDMFSDNFDSKDKDKKDESDVAESKDEDKDEKEDSASSEITWEIKWSQEESAAIHGPHTSEQMQAWSSAGYFKNGAWVRKIGKDEKFYSASRIDFELYI